LFVVTIKSFASVTDAIDLTVKSFALMTDAFASMTDAIDLTVNALS